MFYTLLYPVVEAGAVPEVCYLQTSLPAIEGGECGGGQSGIA